ncbi:MAG: sarcosine oxidase subunit gamma [Propionibacteriales bacterium]|nr:sarcosine oxidase subunit gamma [Propionibacteriales bacterium]
MAPESLLRRTPLGPLADHLQRICAGPRFSCREDAFRALSDVRCAEGADLDAVEAVGATLPAIGRLTSIGGTLVLGLGPRWWMVDASEGSPAVVEAPRVAAVDISAQRTPLVMRGDAVRQVLSHGTSLDVHPDYFPVGSCAQTLLAKTGVVLARTAEDEYRVWVRASFARYLGAWIIDASVEYR